MCIVARKLKFTLSLLIHSEASERFFKAEKGLNLDLQLNESSFFNEDWMVANVVPLDLDTGRREERANKG